MTRNQDFLFVNRNNENWCRRFFTDVSNQIVASRFGATVYIRSHLYGKVHLGRIQTRA